MSGRKVLVALWRNFTTEQAVRVFVLGSTGSIGSPTLQKPIERGHHVWALAQASETLGHRAMSVRCQKATFVVRYQDMASNQDMASKM
jgi:uncharacterized protein YbjT (DUF2867 family)